MENKGIYIDGVDVSGCLYYIDRDGSCSSHDCECIKCIQNVCFYKDYKRKEQECEELKSVRDMWMSKCEQEIKTSEFFQDRFDELKRTLTEIKEVLQFYNNITIGTYKGKGVFEFEVCNENAGKLIFCYDTNPAKQALQKIDEAISE